MMARSRRLEADHARIAELERELGYAEPETRADRYLREYQEWCVTDRRRETNEARAMIAGFLWLIGLCAWNPLCWAAGQHSPAIGFAHPWVMWLTCAWDVPAAAVLIVGGMTFVVWLLSGRNLLGRWL